MDDNGFKKTVEYYVVRQPTFDKKKSLWGYELFFHGCDDDGCRFIHNPDAEEISKVVDGLPRLTKGLPPNSLISLNACLFLDFEGLADILPPEQVILNCPCDRPNPELLAKAPLLREMGYRLSVAPYDGSPHAEELLEHAGIVKIDFSLDPKQIMSLRSKLRSNYILIADNVMDWEEFEGAKALGFDYFQGPFFAEAETVRGQKIPTHRSTRLYLMSALSGDDVDLEKVINIIASDPPLAYRLLQFINSPAFGFRAEVDAIKRAVALMGVRPLRSWAMLVLISDMDTSDKGNELAWNTLQRALFLKLVGETIPQGTDPDKLFLLGMFSNIEAVIGIPLDDILTEVRLDTAINDALKSETGKLAPWIKLLRALDSKEQAALNTLLDQVGLPSPKAATLYMQASELASGALRNVYCAVDENEPDL